MLNEKPLAIAETLNPPANSFHATMLAWLRSSRNSASVPPANETANHTFERTLRNKCRHFSTSYNYAIERPAVLGLTAFYTAIAESNARDDKIITKTANT